MRTGEVARRTTETDITVQLTLDGQGQGEIATGIGFFDHMLTAFAKHSGFDVAIKAEGDLEVDGHHTVEDVGICLGKALRQAVGDGSGIARFGEATVPMDEALVQAVVDVGGRSFLACQLTMTSPLIGAYDTQLTIEFLRALAANAGLTLHVRQLAGSNDHHIVEAAYKAVGRALGAACQPNSQGLVLSTKGTLEG